MAQANHSIQQKALIQLTTAAHCLAMLRSRNAVKEELKKHGLKVSAYSAREINVWAQLFLEDHAAELIPDALTKARAMILAGTFGKRAARALCAELNNSVQSQTQPNSMGSTVQMSGAK